MEMLEILERNKKAEQEKMEANFSFLKELVADVETTEQQLLQEVGFDIGNNELLEYDPDGIMDLEKNEFTYEQIGNLAIKYRLKFLHPSFYNSKFPKDLPKHIMENADMKTMSEYRADPNKHTSQFLILAPSKAFNLRQSPRAWTWDKDPILFQRIEKENGSIVYKAIHKWGKELNPLRRIMMWPLQTMKTYVSFSTIVTLFIMIIIFSGPLFEEAPPDVTLELYAGVGMLILLFTAIFFSVAGIIISKFDAENLTSDHRWRSTHL